MVDEEAFRVEIFQVGNEGLNGSGVWGQLRNGHGIFSITDLPYKSAFHRRILQGITQKPIPSWHLIHRVFDRLHPVDNLRVLSHWQ